MGRKPDATRPGGMVTAGDGSGLVAGLDVATGNDPEGNDLAVGTGRAAPGDGPALQAASRQVRAAATPALAGIFICTSRTSLEA